MLRASLGSPFWACSLLLFLFCHIASPHGPTGGSKSDAQLLDCAISRSTTSGRLSQEALCTKSQGAEQSALLSPADERPSLSIDFNNTLRARQVDQLKADPTGQNCTSEAAQQATTDVVCAPKQTPQESPAWNSIRVAISLAAEPNTSQSQTQTDQQGNVNALLLLAGSTNPIQCRFQVLEPSNTSDLSFKLRWLRSVVSLQGLKSNQSITASESENESAGSAGGALEPRQRQISVSASRIWTTQRDGGLDLLLNDVVASDSGDYFCQALSGGEIVLDERRVHISVSPADALAAAGGEAARPPELAGSSGRLSDSQDDDASSFYSADNLDKLLPSLCVKPNYREMAAGDSVQLACVTDHLDPDPDPSKIEWTFEQFTRPGYEPESAHYRGAGVTSFGLPNGTSQVGNLLIVWSMSHGTIGIYKCSLHLDEFNLTVEASGELAMRPSVDSAPIVYMTPELLRLSANGSARVQCEATGYPPPRIEWYRVDGSNASVAPQPSAQDSSGHSNGTAAGQPGGSSIEQLDGLEVQKLESRDAMAYCLEFGCSALGNLEPATRKQQRQQLAGGEKVHRRLVTGLSWMQIERAQAGHQGQFVCKATNKHGTNQASSIVDVEFKEVPRVEVAEEHRLQTIVLTGGNGSEISPATEQQSPTAAHQSVSFRCTVKGGQPKPTLRWLRTSGGRDAFKSRTSDFYKSANILVGHESAMTPRRHSNSLEIYDLTSVSSATSRVSTRSEDDGRSLVLQLSTISSDDEGDYICLGENESGRHSATAHLVVRKPAQVRILEASPRMFRPNDSFQLDCLVSGHPSPIDIEWSRTDLGAFFALISRHSSTLTADQERAVLKFDRVSRDEAGEYTCAARDPSDASVVLRDTIMLVVEGEEQDKLSPGLGGSGSGDGASSSYLLPKLLVRPTRVMVEPGSNVTLDCLAVAGLQPTVVEWLAPATAINSPAAPGPAGEHVSIRPYYRSSLVSLALEEPSASLLQFGSKLRLFNVTKAHSGVYQCKGRNKVGTENAPALVELIEDPLQPAHSGGFAGNTPGRGPAGAQTKTKVAKKGSNIELRCQVSGMVEKPATSWSREDRELPSSSVQMDHNLWIQNLTKADEGLYLCSARSNEPNEIIQARIRLLVRDDESDARKLGAGRYNSASLSAKIVASKTHLNPGDSVTLECVISFVDNSTQARPTSGDSSMAYRQAARLSSSDLSELERQVIWTNLHSGQSLFQDNVYIQNNLLIIYDLKSENSATYRCNYNDLTQFTDHRLQVGPSGAGPGHPVADASFDSPRLEPPHGGQQNAGGPQMKYITTSVGSRQVLECGSTRGGLDYFWTRGWGPAALAAGTSSQATAATRRRVGRDSEPLTLEALETHQADLYQCYQRVAPNGTQYQVVAQYLVEVRVVSARFVQRPISFVTLPAVSDANHQLELELKFYPENEHGLMLFSGGAPNNLVASQTAHGGGASSRTAASLVPPAASADFISLGLVRGHLEFRFELGDGVTLVRSGQALEMNQWHRVLIERNRRGATMWLDGLQPYSNSSAGKFFNLNLDSMLYVGGHQIFLTLPSSANSKPAGQSGWSTRANASSAGGPPQGPARLFYGFARGFQGCISSLKINRRELNLMARNRSVSVGTFECDKLECPPANGAQPSTFDCPQPTGLCQVDRSTGSALSSANMSSLSTASAARRRQSRPTADLRCICVPGFGGSACRIPVRQDLHLEDLSGQHSSQAPAGNETATSKAPLHPDAMQTDCEPRAGCNSNGTAQCQALSSNSHRCHCKLGFAGEHCDQVIGYESEQAVGFNRSSYVWLTFNSAQEVGVRLVAAAASSKPANESVARLSFNETEHSRLITFTEHQNITFRLHTRASYGLLFYAGQDLSSLASDNATRGSMQTSKSIMANLLARLPATKGLVNDFLAITLVDGHVELSYELGSGLAISRTSRRYNDGEWHRIELVRAGKSSRLLIDESTRLEVQSPGKLSMLNVAQDIHLGGLPQSALESLISTSGGSSGASLLSAFSGCLAGFYVNSLGPITLVRNDHLTSLRSAQNLVPCGASLMSFSLMAVGPAAGPAPSDKIAIDQVAAIKPTTASPPQATMTLKRTTKRPPKASYTTESDGDDSDELARSS